MINIVYEFASPEEALGAFRDAGLTVTGGDGVERIITANHEMAILEIGQKFTMTDPGSFPDVPPTYAGDGKHWVAYRNLVHTGLTLALFEFLRWASVRPNQYPDDPEIPEYHWL